MGIGIIFAVLFQFISEPSLKLFTSETAVILFGVQYLRTYVIDCFFASIHFCFSGYFTACGYSIISFVHNLFSIILFRIPGTWLAAKYFPDSLYAMGLAAPLGSLFSVIVCVAVFIWLQKRIAKKSIMH